MVRYRPFHSNEIIDTRDNFKQRIEQARNRLAPNITVINDLEIPREAQKFYEDFGLLEHPFKRDEKTKRPILVKQLTQYQKDFWNYKGNIVEVKSNKIGQTTTSTLEMFQSRLLPEEAGFDAILGAQTKDMANGHLLDLKKMVLNSRKYSKYLILDPQKEVGGLREEKSKLEMMYIKNPYDPQKFSRIIALGGSVPSGFSWKRVNRVHLSDISLLKKKDEELEFFGAVYSRLANTNGIFKIESIPLGRRGEFWRIWKAANKIKTKDIDDNEPLAIDQEGITSSFKPIMVTYREGLEAGVISEDYIEKAKRDLPPQLFARLFECDFMADSDQWFDENLIKQGAYGIKDPFK